ncbi:hypothetical protein PanWU01x14_139580 [Parasponia andersonii]|uniref:RNase H type-1 domain-containing protein n=1 Tax=Parasponia andersonii TaxID=3476 RepID=A0A2P5CMI5_PARAD|nr:hypothetical protein PanWU01x14_139580 [Parasponia andersonii]
MNLSSAEQQWLVWKGVVRDFEGVVVGCFSKKFRGSLSVDDAELLAIREAPLCSIQQRFNTDEIESDSLRAIQSISSPSHVAHNATITSTIVLLLVQANLLKMVTWCWCQIAEQRSLFHEED